jgi:sigma-B regulation protein RsbU (phosphoserine phosphatase)
MGNLSFAIRSIPHTLLFSVSGYVFAGTFFASLIIFLIFLDAGSNEFPWYLGFAFHLSLELLLLGYVQKDKQWYKNIASMRDSESIIEDMKSLAIILGMAGLLNFLGLFDTIISFKNNVFSLAVSILYAGYMGIVFGMSSSLLFRLMTQRPHALSKKLTFWIIGLSGFTLFLQLFFYGPLQVGIHIVAGIIGLLGFYNTKGLLWFSEITKKQKTDLAWSSIVILLSISIIAGNYEQITYVALNQIMSVAEPFIFAIGIWLLLIAGRLSMIAINSLPTAGLIDRKTLEFSALSELTAIASTTQNYQQILQNAVQLIEKAIEVNGLYGKIYIQDQQFETYHGDLGTELSIIDSNGEFISWKEEQNSIGNLFEKPESMDPHNLLRIKSIVSLTIQIDRNKHAEILLAHEEPYHFTPEDEIILSTFADSLRIAIINASLLTIELEHQKFEQEMEIARGVQNSLLPQNIPMSAHYSIATYSMPSKIVGGDFYDVFEMDNGNTCIIIADVSGKGIPAAFWMATIRGILLSLQYGGFSPKDILIHLQRSLADILDPQVFITASCLILEKSSNSIQYARAGHMPLLRIHEETLTEYIPRGLGIGLTKNIEFFEENLEEISLQIEDNELLILFTDGLTDLPVPDNESEQYSSMKRFLKESTMNPKSLIEVIDREIQISQKSNLVDDITVISVKRNASNH